MINHLENEQHDYKIHQLPLARIKKVMKADPEVKMISAEAPILFAKGCDIFITELTMRAWIHAEDNKRRTLQRSDIAAALAKSDTFDFLIDIVTREEASGHPKRSAGGAGGSGSAAAGAQGAAGSASASQQMQQQAPQQQPHHMGHPQQPDYASLGQHGMGQDPDYRSQVTGAGMYGGHVPQDPNVGGYGAPQQMQGFEGMYNPYPTHMGAPQQVSLSLPLSHPLSTRKGPPPNMSSQPFSDYIHMSPLSNPSQAICPG